MAVGGLAALFLRWVLLDLPSLCSPFLTAGETTQLYFFPKALILFIWELMWFECILSFERLAPSLLRVVLPIRSRGATGERTSIEVGVAGPEERPNVGI